MTGPLVAAALTLFIFVGGWFAWWEWGVTERKLIRQARVEAFRAAFNSAYPPVQLDAPYAAAITHTLLRAELASHDRLVSALDRRPPVLEVVA